MIRDVDLKAIAEQAMERYGFFPHFPEDVLEEVTTLTSRTLTNGATDVRDLRSLLWSSIDNWDSMDLDQVEYCEQASDGEIHIKVAIADVDLYVPRHSQADRYGAHNGTSVYTGVETFPLFPDLLSKGATSLLPGQDRRAIVVEYAVLPDGDFRPGAVYRAVIQNKAKLVYEEIGGWLDGTGPRPSAVRDIPGLEDQLLLQTEASRCLKRYRTEQGALELDTIEAQAVMEDGQIQELVVPQKNPARYLIEDFMIAANGTMVAFLGNAGISMIQRVVRVPKYWNRIIETAAMFGERLPPSPDARALSRFLLRRKEADPERFSDLSLTIVKLLGPGEYMMLAPEEPPTGHFGLAVTDYTHGTAPNRRYVDLIIQRLLKSVLDQRPSPYLPKELEDRAAWLTEREKQANKVERFLRKAAAAVLLQDRIGESFPAIVTGASEKGTYVRLLEPPAEGRVMQGEQGLMVGQKVHVRLLRTDPNKGFIDFERIGRGTVR
jgi:VacB/RNase II family 3'-5' exoribonuclease